MPTTANTINYYIAADGTLRDGQAGSIAQTPRIYYGTEYAVTLSFPASTIVEGDQLQVAVNRSRTFFSSASATGDAPVAAVAKHEVTAAEATAQAVTLTLSSNTRAMIDQVNGINHPVRGFFGVHLLRGQSFISLAVADAFMLSVESGPDAISPSLPVVDYPTREEAEALAERSENAAERAEEAAAGIVPPLQLSAPPTTSTSGSVGQLAVWHDAVNNKNHVYHLGYISIADSSTFYHWEECVLVSMGNVAGGYPVLDEDGLVYPANLPVASTSQLGIMRLVGAYRDSGLTINSGQVQVYSDNDVIIRGKWDGRTSKNTPLVPNTIDYAVRSVLPNVTEIPAATSDYSLVDSSATTLNHSHTFIHTPSQAPTYRLPSVSDTTISHYIELTVDFTNVQTYSFLDANGDVTFQSYANPTKGDVWAFRCWWYGGKWRIAPTQIKNCVTRQLVNGSIAITDAVAGDALALRMVAPRSVVMNQWVQNGNFADGSTGWRGNRISLTAQNGVMTCMLNNTSAATVSVACDFNGQKDHTYLTRYGLKMSFDGTSRYIMYNGSAAIYAESGRNVSANTEKYLDNKVTLENAVASITLYPMYLGSGNYAQGDSFQFLGMQIVDLTQYFNGDQTLIDSITSWDDLVAYDPRFAQYVEYNTGTVAGVQPQVKVGGKNLLDDSIKGYNNTFLFIGSTTLDGGMLLPAGTYTWRIFFNGNESTSQSGGTGYISIDGAVAYSKHTVTLTKPSYCHCRVYPKPASDDFSKYTAQIELGDQATAYEPYHDGGTVQAPEELFAVGTAADEHEAVAGKVGHRVGYTRMYNRSSGTDYFAPSERYPYGFAIMGFNSRAAGPNLLSTKYPRVEGFTTNKTIHAGGSGTNIYVVDDALVGKTASEIREILADVMLYYELDTPTTFQSTPSQISLQAGDNVAMQTDGGRLAPIDITYESDEL